MKSYSSYLDIKYGDYKIQQDSITWWFWISVTVLVTGILIGKYFLSLVTLIFVCSSFIVKLKLWIANLELISEYKLLNSRVVEDIHTQELQLINDILIDKNFNAIRDVKDFEESFKVYLYTKLETNKDKYGTIIEKYINASKDNSLTLRGKWLAEQVKNS